MKTLIVTDDIADWPFDSLGAEVVEAWKYLTDESYASLKNVRLFNLCRSYRYQSTGYYVSLLAEARKHRPMPNVIAIQDLQPPCRSILRMVSPELDELIQHSLAPLHSDEFVLSVYFGRNLAARYDRLSRQLFSAFQCPLLQFSFNRRDRWQLRSVRALASRDLPKDHREFAAESAQMFFAKGSSSGRSRRKRQRYDLAILYEPAEGRNSPSNPKAIERFTHAAEELGLAAELLGRDDAGRLLEFDALFIRETTQMNHFTYRWSRRAAQEGMVVMDDPQSIARCANKVYLAEALARNGVQIPRTVLVHRDNACSLHDKLGYPCVRQET